MIAAVSGLKSTGRPTVVIVMSRSSFWYLFLHFLSTDTGLMTRFVYLTTLLWLLQVAILGQPLPLAFTCGKTRFSADHRFSASHAWLHDFTSFQRHSPTSPRERYTYLVSAPFGQPPFLHAKKVWNFAHSKPQNIESCYSKVISK